MSRAGRVGVRVGALLMGFNGVCVFEEEEGYEGRRKRERDETCM